MPHSRAAWRSGRARRPWSMTARLRCGGQSRTAPAAGRWSPGPASLSSAAWPSRIGGATRSCRPRTPLEWDRDRQRGNTSTTPPRLQNCPWASTGSAGAKPASASRSASSVGDIVCDARSSTVARRKRSGALTRGATAAAEDTMTAALRRAIAARARARAEATSRCGEMPRYGSTSGEGNGRMRRSTSASARPSRAAAKKRTSAVIRSTSASCGTTTNTGVWVATVAIASACAAGVNPLIDPDPGAPSPRPARLAADFNNAWSVSEVVANDTNERPYPTRPWMLARGACPGRLRRSPIGSRRAQRASRPRSGALGVPTQRLRGLGAQPHLTMTRP